MVFRHLNRYLFLVGLATFAVGIVALEHYLVANCPSSKSTIKKDKKRKRFNLKLDKAKQCPLQLLTAQERTEHAKNMAITRHVGPGSRADKGYRTRHSGKSNDGCWPVPGELSKELSEIDLCYYESIQQPQSENTCGSRSLANALAISDAVENDRLNPQVVKKCAASYNWMHANDNLTNVDIIEKAQEHELENVYVIDYLTKDLCKRNRKKANPFTIISSTDHDEMVCGANEGRINDEIIKKIRSNQNITAHFICFLEPIADDAIAHAVLVSLIKQKGKKPSLIYMDSCNTPLKQEWQAAAYMSYIYWQCIAA